MAGRGVAVSLARVALLAGPTALAFFAGGYFDGPRAWAGAGAWACVAVAVAAGVRLRLSRAALVAIAGLSLLAAWALLSMLWAPTAGGAYHAGQIVVLYVGALVAATLLLRGRAAAWVEPSLAAGTAIVIGYGLAGRLAPGLLHYARSVSAEGRLEQPLTYWNAMGELAAIGVVLCARLAGDAERPAAVRTAAAAAAAPLGLGLWITYSRGALVACLAGLVTLVVLAPRVHQLLALATVLAAGALATIAGVSFSGVALLRGTLATREHQGAIVLVTLVVIAAVAGFVQHQLVSGPRDRALRLPRGAAWWATAAVIASLAVAIVVGAHESSGVSQGLPGGATRLTSLRSNRYAYWSVALRAFGTEPLHGVGAGGWSVDWLRWRTFDDFAQDAHSLELQTLAELGVVGLVLLLSFFGGVAVAARRAAAAAPSLVAGPAAALVVYLVHSPLDWDWQMPAVTLVAMVLAGQLLGLAGDGLTVPRRSVAPRG